MAQNALVPRASAPLVPANQRLVRQGRKFYYRVQPGDNLIKVGQFFNRLPHMLDRVVKLNPEIRGPNGAPRIRIGQLLRVPAVWVFPELKSSASTLGLFDDDEDYTPDNGDETSDQGSAGTWQEYANEYGYGEDWSPAEVADFMGLTCDAASGTNQKCGWQFVWGWPFVQCICEGGAVTCPPGLYPVFSADGKTFLGCQSENAGKPCKTPDGKEGAHNDEGKCIPNQPGPGDEKDKGGASKGTGGGQVQPGGGKVDRGKTNGKPSGKDSTDSGGGTDKTSTGNGKTPFYKNKWVIAGGVGVLVIGGLGIGAAVLDSKSKKKGAEAT